MSYKTFRRLLAVITMTVFLVSASTASAATRFSILGFSPVPDAGPLFTVLDAETLKQFQWVGGTSLGYGQNPLIAKRNNADINVINRFVYEHFYSTFGITDWLYISADMPMAWYTQFTNPDTVTAATSEIGAGDLELAFKFRAISRNDSPVGIAIAPFVTFPTGKEKYFLGNDGFTGGGKLIIDSEIFDRATLALNVGAVMRKHVAAYGLNFKDQFTISGGVNVKIIKLLSIVGEVNAITPFGDFFQKKNTSPVEGRAGLQWHFGENDSMLLNTAVGFGANYGTGVPYYRVFAGFSYRSPAKERVKKLSPEQPIATTKGPTAVVPAVVTTIPIEGDFARLKANVERDSIYFDSNSYRMTAENAYTMGTIGDLLFYNNDLVNHISIDGYADSTGSAAINEIISRERAELVKWYFNFHSIPPEKMEVRAFGKKDPAATNATPEGRAKNRRVEVRIK